MPSKQDKPKRWRPRFSVRTLAALVTLVCCYAACWGPTKTRGVADVMQHTIGIWEIDHRLSSPSSSGPNTVVEFQAMAEMPLVVSINHANGQEYYFWFFGYFAKLPYERDVNVWDNHFLSGSSVAPTISGSHPAAPIGIDNH